MSEAEYQEPQDNAPAPRSVLAVARVAQNLTIADVARQLRLSERQVEALEAGDFDRLPGPVFVRGFMRNYARLLKLDPDRVLSSIQSELPVRAEEVNAPSFRNIPFPPAKARRWPKYLLAALVITLGLGAYELYWNDAPPVVTVKPVAPPPAAPAVSKAPADVVQVAANTPAAPEASGAPGGVALPDVRPDAAAQAAAPASAAAPLPETPPQTAIQDKPDVGELHMVFEMDSWVEVRDRDGRVIFSRLNPRGTEQRIRGTPPFALIIGNARGVRVAYNDRPIDLDRYIKVSVARLSVQ